MDDLEITRITSSLSQSSSEGPGHHQEVDQKERRRQQNRMAQRKYRKKLSQQLKQSEVFALQAQLKLAEVARTQTAPGQCPMCDHCKGSIATQNSSPQSPFIDLTPINQNHFIQSDGGEESRPVLYGANLPLEDADFETSYFGDDTLTAVLFRSCVPEINPAAFSPAIPKTGELEYVQKEENGNIRTPSMLPNIGNETQRETPENNAIPTSQTLCRSTSTSTFSSSRDPLSQTEMGLHIAARQGFTTIMAILLSTGAGVDCRDEMGRTPLHQCAETGQVEGLEVLLDAGADPNSTDDTGTSVILAAVKAGKEMVVKTLAEALNGP